MRKEGVLLGWVAPASLAVASLVVLTLGSLEILHGSWLDRSNGSWPAWFFRVVLYSLLALAVYLFLRLGMLEREIKRDQQVIIRAQCCPEKVAPSDGKSRPLNVLWPVLPGNDLKSRGRKWSPERSIRTRHNEG